MKNDINIKLNEITNTLTESDYYKLILQIINIAIKNNLSVKQSQKLFSDCTELIMDVPIKSFYETDINNNIHHHTTFFEGSLSAESSYC